MKAFLMLVALVMVGAEAISADTLASLKQARDKAVARADSVYIQKLRALKNRLLRYKKYKAAQEVEEVLTEFLAQRERTSMKDGLVIVKAKYGAGKRWVNVTRILRKAIKNNTLSCDMKELMALNKINDPAFGVHKYLIIIYKRGVKKYTKTFKESELELISLDESADRED